MQEQITGIENLISTLSYILKTDTDTTNVIFNNLKILLSPSQWAITTVPPPSPDQITSNKFILWGGGLKQTTLCKLLYSK